MDKKRQEELIKKMKYITILDFEVGRVFQYKVVQKKIRKTFEDYDYEKFITDSGHKLNNCEWMIHDNSEIISNERNR